MLLANLVICASRYVRAAANMSETVPLGPALSIQLISIIVRNIFGQCLNFMFEAFTGESGNFRMV